MLRLPPLARRRPGAGLRHSASERPAFALTVRIAGVLAMHWCFVCVVTRRMWRSPRTSFRVVPLALHKVCARNRRQDAVVAEARFRVRTGRAPFARHNIAGFLAEIQVRRLFENGAVSPSKTNAQAAPRTRAAALARSRNQLSHAAGVSPPGRSAVSGYPTVKLKHISSCVLSPNPTEDTESFW
jgi:hypothetical protein